MNEDILLTDEEILSITGIPNYQMHIPRAIAKAQLKKLVEWLDKRKRNTYLPLEEPCEWVAFTLDDWQALLRGVLGEKGGE